MSKLDKRFKPLKWEVNLTNTAWKAEALGHTYYVVKVDAAFMENAGFLAIHGIEFSAVYALWDDAKAKCQLTYEERLRYYIND